MESRGELQRPRVGEDVLLPAQVVQVVESEDGDEPVVIVRPTAIKDVRMEHEPTLFAVRLGELERP